jgi:hypothetical protein
MSTRPCQGADNTSYCSCGVNRIIGTIFLHPIHRGRSHETFGEWDWMRFLREGFVTPPPGASELRPWPTRRPPLGASSRQGLGPYPGERGPERAKDRGGAPEGVRPSRKRARCVRKNVALTTRRRPALRSLFCFEGAKQTTACPRRKQQGRRSYAV